MKTFEEAVNTVIVKLKPDQREDQQKKIIAQLLDESQRLKDLIQEITANERVTKALNMMTVSSCCAFHAAQNALITGIRIGIEMEKNETGGVDFK